MNYIKIAHALALVVSICSARSINAMNVRIFNNKGTDFKAFFYLSADETDIKKHLVRRYSISDFSFPSKVEKVVFRGGRNLAGDVAEQTITGRGNADSKWQILLSTYEIRSKVVEEFSEKFE